MLDQKMTRMHDEQVKILSKMPVEVEEAIHQCDERIALLVCCVSDMGLPGQTRMTYIGVEYRCWLNVQRSVYRCSRPLPPLHH